MAIIRCLSVTGEIVGPVPEILESLPWPQDEERMDLDGQHCQYRCLEPTLETET